MRTLAVLTVGVSLVFGLQAADALAENKGAKWTSSFNAGWDAMQQHDFAQAARLYEECISSATSDDQRETALGSYGVALSHTNQLAEAKASLEQVLDGPHPTSNPERRAVLTSVLASVEHRLGDYPAAESALDHAIGSGFGSPGVRGLLMLKLADLYREEGREPEALAVLREADQLQGIPRDTQAALLVETGEATGETGLWKESFAVWKKVGEMADSDHSPWIEAMYSGGLGETWYEFGDMTRAEPLLRRSVQLLRDDPGTAAPQMGTALAALARVYIAEDKLALAEEALNEAVAKDEGNFDTGHPQMGVLLEMRADLMSRRGETDAARDDLERARLIMSDHFGAESAAVAGILAAGGVVEQRANQPDAAVAQFRLAMQILSKAGGDNAKLRNKVAARYAAALKAAHKPAEAKAVLAAANGNGQSFREK